MADWVDAYHGIEVNYFEIFDDDVRGDYKGCAWMDEATLYVEMRFKPPSPLSWVPFIALAAVADDDCGDLR